MKHDYENKPWRFPVFSFGINANITNLQARCPNWDGTWILASLRGYRMEFSKQYPGFMKQTYCNIHMDDSERVWGALVWLDEKSFKSIDNYEGFPEHYQRRRVAVHAEDGNIVPSWAYISEHYGDGAPSIQYYLGVLTGLMEIGAPEGYIEKIIRECGKRWTGPGYFARQESLNLQDVMKQLNGRI